eukprot:9790-Amphidinium_carterae.1
MLRQGESTHAFSCNWQIACRQAPRCAIAGHSRMGLKTDSEGHLLACPDSTLCLLLALGGEVTNHNGINNMMGILGESTSTLSSMEEVLEGSVPVMWLVASHP